MKMLTDSGRREIGRQHGLRLATAIVALATGLAPASGFAETLRWKLKAGEVLKYSLEEKMASTIKIADREVKSTSFRTIDLTWTVKSVSAAGDADVTARINRVRMKVNQPPFQQFDFDSDSDKTDAAEPFGPVAKQIKAMAGAEFTFQMKASGAVEDFKIPAETLTKLRQGLPAEGGDQGAFSEQALAEMLKQTSPPAFPDEDLKAGKSWAAKPARLPSPMGVIVLDKSFTFQGPDPKNPAVAQVDTETKVGLEPGDGAAASAKIRSQQGKGRLDFNTETGRITSTSLTQKMEIVIAGPTGQNIDQTTDTTTIMTLKP